MTDADPKVRAKADTTFVSARTAAARLGLSAATVRRRVDAGILAGRRDPATGRYQVRARAIADLLELRAALRRSAALPGAAAPRASYLRPRPLPTPEPGPTRGR